MALQTNLYYAKEYNPIVLKIIMNKLPVLGYMSWCSLGFIRGTNSYRHHHSKYEKDEYLYLNSVCYGFFGIALYANPFLVPYTFYKELYRFEVNLRNLEKDKRSDYYYNLC